MGVAVEFRVLVLGLGTPQELDTKKPRGRRVTKLQAGRGHGSTTKAPVESH